MRVAVISPHPDDESVGCGGTIRRHSLNGDDVTVLFLSSGEQGGHTAAPETVGPMREREARTACGILGVAAVDFWRLPDGRLRATSDVVSRLADHFSRTTPDRVYVTHSSESHADHRAAARLARGAADRLRRRPEVLGFEIWTPIDRIDEIVDITETIDDKIRAVRAHQSQCAVLPFDEACRGLARYRGEMHSWPGGAYAEVFTRVL